MNGSFLSLLPAYPSTTPMTSQLVDPLRWWMRDMPPYSDWSALALWSWGADVELARHGVCAVMKRPDYMTGASMYSVIGADASERTVSDVVAEHGQVGLIPEDVADRCRLDDRLEVHEDPDNHDYVIDPHGVEAIQRHRQRAGKFARDHSSAVKRTLDLTSTDDCSSVLDVYDLWVGARSMGDAEAAPERLALGRLIERAALDDLVITGVQLGDRLVAFAISEIHDPTWATCHFQKAETSLAGVGEFSERWHLDRIRERTDGSCHRLNLMQDLGIPGLRTHKQRLRPVELLRKYRVGARRPASPG